MHNIIKQNEYCFYLIYILADTHANTVCILYTLIKLVQVYNMLMTIYKLNYKFDHCIKLK